MDIDSLNHLYFSDTKRIHLNHGDEGLRRALVRTDDTCWLCAHVGCTSWLYFLVVHSWLYFLVVLSSTHRSKCRLGSLSASKLHEFCLFDVCCLMVYLQLRLRSILTIFRCFDVFGVSMFRWFNGSMVRCFFDGSMFLPQFSIFDRQLCPG